MLGNRNDPHLTFELKVMFSHENTMFYGIVGRERHLS